MGKRSRSKLDTNFLDHFELVGEAPGKRRTMDLAASGKMDPLGTPADLPSGNLT